MSTALSWGPLELHSNPPAALCEAAEGGVATSAATRDSLRLLVAADAGRYGLMIAHTFRRAVTAGATLSVVAELLDEAVTRVSMSNVCATLVDVGPGGFEVLHRGGPSPVVVHADGTLTRVVPSMPGPPLGPRASLSGGAGGEIIPAGIGDVLLVTTPGSVESAMHALAAASTPAVADLWTSLHDLGPAEAGSAYALLTP